MVNEQVKQKLAVMNGNLTELRKEKIIKNVKTKYPHLDDEVAILRKMLVILIEKVKQQHPDIDLTEFNEYNTYIEYCKKEAKKELDIVD